MQSTQIPFAKMHGLGNDFVVFDSRGRSARAEPALVRAIGDRHTGVGFDQLAEIETGQDTDITLTFWNADGSKAGACGNATRCVAAHVMGETGADTLSIRTSRGVLNARRTPEGVSVNMGLPQLSWADVPLSQDVSTKHLPLDGDPVAVGMGNPHCVFFVENADGCDPATRGPAIETDPLFSEGTNVEFATVTAPDRIRMRVWERGTGITRACGSGACATGVAAALRGLTGRRVWIDLDGGSLLIDWREDGVWMTGPTAHVFDGVFTSQWIDTHV
ncbi:MAG: diaminopimelate epimerase [Rhodobacterales bacterium]|nr:MAG: diaminopimelate epimerase [Rhodobacterales bacterium]